MHYGLHCGLNMVRCSLTHVGIFCHLTPGTGLHHRNSELGMWYQFKVEVMIKGIKVKIKFKIILIGHILINIQIGGHLHVNLAKLYHI